MNYLNTCLIFIVTIVFFSACNITNKKSGVAYQTKFVNGSTNNKIEILDFGGTGQPMLFLTGMGNSAHIFVDFAPKFSDKFHVYAMSRRGYGASEQTANGYSTDTLAMDILAVTKALNLNKVILIGHSIAGDEISKFASSYPDKVEKVIYLDAAYDHKSIWPAIVQYMPAFPKLTAADTSSSDGLKAYYKKIAGITYPDDEMKNTIVFSTNGKYLKDVTSDEIQGKLVRGLEHPNYKSIQCPALAIYATASTPDIIIPFYSLLDTVNKKIADARFAIYKNFAREQIERFKKEVKKGVVKEMKEENHYIFLSNPVETENYIREFLK